MHIIVVNKVISIVMYQESHTVDHEVRQQLVIPVNCCVGIYSSSDYYIGSIDM